MKDIVESLRELGILWLLPFIFIGALIVVTFKGFNLVYERFTTEPLRRRHRINALLFVRRLRRMRPLDAFLYGIQRSANSLRWLVYDRTGRMDPYNLLWISCVYLSLILGSISLEKLYNLSISLSAIILLLCLPKNWKVFTFLCVIFAIAFYIYWQYLAPEMLPYWKLLVPTALAPAILAAIAFTRRSVPQLRYAAIWAIIIIITLSMIVYDGFLTYRGILDYYGQNFDFTDDVAHRAAYLYTKRIVAVYILNITWFLFIPSVAFSTDFASVVITLLLLLRVIRYRGKVIWRYLIADILLVLIIFAVAAFLVIVFLSLDRSALAYTWTWDEIGVWFYVRWSLLSLWFDPTPGFHAGLLIWTIGLSIFLPSIYYVLVILSIWMIRTFYPLVIRVLRWWFLLIAQKGERGTRAVVDGVTIVFWLGVGIVALAVYLNPF